jgi:hypothetical protein
MLNPTLRNIGVFALVVAIIAISWWWADRNDTAVEADRNGGRAIPQTRSRPWAPPAPRTR